MLGHWEYLLISMGVEVKINSFLTIWRRGEPGRCPVPRSIWANVNGGVGAFLDLHLQVRFDDTLAVTDRPCSISLVKSS
jgi:hypothetical protein